MKQTKILSFQNILQMQSVNKIIVASAGSRKTTYIVESALSVTEDQSILILAYTNNTLNQIRKYIIDRVGFIPPNITIQSWHSFLFSECVKPYQNAVYDKHRIEQIFYPIDGGGFKTKPRFIKKTDIENYFLVNSKYIIAEHLSEFSLICNANSGGLVFNRLEKIYQEVFIDESQDLAGYDFHIVESFLESKIKTTLVGDCRQATYFTNTSSKNKKYKGSNIINLFIQWKADGLCKIEEKNECYRSNQAICDFGDSLYPQLTPTKSVGVEKTEHDGIVLIKTNEVKQYIENYNPTVLRYNVKTNTNGIPAFNFGSVKGLTFDRVLIYPNGPIKKFLVDGDHEKLVPTTKARLYVGITRARYSVAFVFEGKSFLHK